MLSRPGVLRRFSQFIPKYELPQDEELRSFHKFLDNHRDILVLTGAGVSTESGIPDYRSEEVGTFSRTSYKPINYTEFLKDPDARRRFWARNFVGWPRFNSLCPNENHLFISHLLASNIGARLITQNVDGLHSKAYSKHVLELHGNAFWVRCVDCQDTISRYHFQNVLEDMNPEVQTSVGEIRPDGDVEIPEVSLDIIKSFEVPSCEKCGGILKPTVVFFGQNVPQNTVKKAETLVDKCDAMLILGTSVSTLSTYKLVEQAYDTSKFLCLINIGETRVDKMMDLKISTKISEVFKRLSHSCY